MWTKMKLDHLMEIVVQMELMYRPNYEGDMNSRWHLILGVKIPFIADGAIHKEIIPPDEAS